MYFCTSLTAQVAELVDAPVSNTGGATRAGSSPALGTFSLNDPTVDHGRRSLQKAGYIFFDLKMIRVDPVVFHCRRIRKTHPDGNIYFFERSWIVCFCALGK